MRWCWTSSWVFLRGVWGSPQSWLSRASILGWFCTLSVGCKHLLEHGFVRTQPDPWHTYTHTPPRQSINCRHLTSLCCLTGSIIRDATLVNCCRAGVPIWLRLAQDVDGSVESFSDGREGCRDLKQGKSLQLSSQNTYLLRSSNISAFKQAPKAHIACKCYCWQVWGSRQMS